MKIDILTLFPEMFTGFLTTSIIKRSLEKGLVTVNLHDFREFSKDKHKHVDDYPYGGGQGMVLMCEPIVECLKSIASDESFIILMSPQGVTLNHGVAVDLSKKKHLIIICGHYEGFDERIRDYVDMELSIGDYVLTGGELPAMTMTDAIVRLIPGVLGNQQSHEDDSFQDGLLEFPQYTRPRSYLGHDVPDVLLSGNHAHIEQWRHEQKLINTWVKRPDLLEQYPLTTEDQKILETYKKQLKK